LISLTDEILAEKLKAGDVAAAEELYKRWFSRLRSFAMRYLGSSQESEDLVQDLFLKWFKQPQLYASGRSVAAWLHVSLKNQCLNALRNDSKRKNLAALHFSPEPNTLLLPKIDASLLKQDLTNWYNNLSDKERLVFVLRFEQELQLKEISEIMGIPEGSVKSCLFYLLKKVQPLIKKYRYE